MPLRLRYPTVPLTSSIAVPHPGFIVKIPIKWIIHQNRSLTMNALEELNRQVKAASDATGKARELEQLLKQLCVRLAGDISDNIASTEAKCAELREEIANWVGRREEEEEEGIGEEQKYAEVERMAQKLGERIGGIEDALARRELEGHKLEE